MASRRRERPTNRQTQFLFVHHDSTNLDSRVDAEKVNAHVQVLFRRRKHGVNERWEPNLGSQARQLRLKMRNGEFVVPDRQRRRTAEDKKSIRSSLHGALGSGLTPGFSIQKGNSDPFLAMPIAIGPFVNMVLSWHGIHGIPALHPVESAILASPTPSARRTWNHLVFAVQDADLIYPYLASVCAIMMRRTGHDGLKQHCLGFKAQGYVVLQKTLKAPNVIADHLTRDMILHMFWAELATGSPSAARTHLEMLAWIARSCAQGTDLPAEYRLKFLAADTNLAVSQLTLPVASEKESSVEKEFENWRRCLSWEMKKAVVVKALDLHDSITEPALRTVFGRLRELVAVTELVAHGGIKDVSVFQWMDARLLWCESHLVAACLAHTRSSVNGGPWSAFEMSMRARCTSLAALAWICSTWASSNRGMGPTMIERLKKALLDDSLMNSSADVVPDLIIWMLYAGAALESRSAASQPTDAWFLNHLAIKVKQVGLVQVTDTLKRFLYSEGVCPLDLPWRTRLLL